MKLLLPTNLGVAVAFASLFLASPARAAAPALGREDLAPVHKLANTMKGQLECNPVEPGVAPPAANVEAAAEYAHIAGMFAFAAQHYPADEKGDRVSQINALIDDASLAYERAYDCAPSLSNAFYLLRAIELLGSRVVHLVQVEKLDESAPRVQELVARRDRLRDKLPSPPQCPVCIKCETCPKPPPPPSGYRGLYTGRLALSLGLGGGQARLGGERAGVIGHLTLRTAFGARFVLGKQERHLLTAGLHYALQAGLSYASDSLPAARPPRPSAIHQAGPYLEYAFAPHPHFSVHGHLSLSISAGVVWFEAAGGLRNLGFSSLTPGGGGAICTLRGVLCARGHGYGSVLQKNSLTGYDLTLAVDLFRVTDALLARRDR
ncbi:hypothetical protein [Nannocystis pusilla]|uniref:Uncharacterized protein n=1 Tax=Nannocystis pusilla TaxID=889268 RepID=A0ABS7TM95_9BACT|nr:hypothetical protein [Nannocystis pusilla]MBZ5709316.1 hypothetical protein [Nannocystis pusilla]